MNELRQQDRTEKQRFRVEQIGEETLARRSQIGPAFAHAARCIHCRQGVAQNADGNPDQIAGTDDPDELKRDRKSMKKCSQTKCGKGDVTSARDCKPCCRCKRMCPALCCTSLEEQKHIRSRNKKCSSQCTCI